MDRKGLDPIQRPWDWFWFALGLAVFAALLSGCKTKCIETERVVDHYNIKIDTLRDSIANNVFVKVWQQGDTIYKDSIVKIYKDRQRVTHDTLTIRDTLRVTQTLTNATPTANTLTWWQNFRISAFDWLVPIIGVGVIAYTLYIIRKKQSKV